MRTCRGSLLLEGLLCIFLMGIFTAMGSSGFSPKWTESAEEAPVILLGLLNEEMRNSAESMVPGQIRSSGSLLTFLDNRQMLKKRMNLEEGIQLHQGNTFDPRFTSTTSYSFLINGSGGQSGRITFYRNGVKERKFIMVHVGTMTMDVRDSDS